MYAAALAGASHPAVAALFGLGAAGLAAVVVAMAWSVNTRQIRLAEQLARRQLVVTADADAAAPAANRDGAPVAAAEEPARTAGNGNGAGNGHGKGNGNGAVVVIDGPDTVVAGEQARYRLHPPGRHTVVSWAVGGGSVSQAPDPAHPDELLLMADQPGSLTVMVRAREGMTERRATKPVTAVPDVPDPAPPFTPKLFLHGWGLIAIAVLIVGFAAALAALGTLSSSDFIALATSLAALLGVVAAVRGTSDPSGRASRPTTRPRP